jgi:hypothetical protein
MADANEFKQDEDQDSVSADFIDLAERRPAPITPDTEDLGGPAMPLWSGRSSYSFVLPEYVPDLVGKQAIRTYDKMRRSSAQVHAALSMVKTPILTAPWYMNPASDAPIDREVAQFVSENLFNRLRRPWESFVREASSFLDFGFYPFEKIWQMGTWTPEATEHQPRPRTRPVAWLLDLAPRHPYYIFGWNRDKTGMVTDLWYGSYQVDLPMSKLALFTLDSEADDPTGRSILRSAYMHWFYLMNLYRVDAIQKERHGIGIPQITLPPGHSEEDKNAANELGRNLRTNEEAHVVVPPGWAIDFLEPKGHLVDPIASAAHHGKQILENVLAQFIDAGGGSRGAGGATGSRAGGAASILFEVFMEATRSIIAYMASVLNTFVIPELVNYNYDVEAYPTIGSRQVDETKLRALSVAIVNSVRAGALTPDGPLEVFLRDFMALPDATEPALARSIEDRLSVIKPQPNATFQEEGGDYLE